MRVLLWGLLSRRSRRASAARGRVVGAFVAAVAVFGLWVVPLAGSAGAALPSGCSEALSVVKCSFSSTGSEQTFAVPTGVQSVEVSAVGAPGGSGFFSTGRSGLGAVVDATVPLPAGTAILYVEVGGVGASGSCGGGTVAGGFNGGGSAVVCDGAGGGASDVRTVSCGSICAGGGSSDSLNSRLVIGGAGGGGAACSGPAGPGNGGSAGDQSVSGPGDGGANCGLGGDGGFGGTKGGGGGASGQLGQGGAAATNGGGGGGGYYGGGAGDPGNVGGGGAGSSFWVAGATGSMSKDTTGVPLVTISYEAPNAEATPTALSFATQPQSTLSVPQTVTLANTGKNQLLVSGLTFTGPNPQDFLVTSNGCLGPIPAGGSCTLGVAFAPHGQGARSATLQISSNDPAGAETVKLSGTGGQLPQGPPGKNGTNGTNGRIELVVCKTVTKTIVEHGKRTARKVQVCTTRLVSGVVKFVLDSDDVGASIARAGRTYATGYAVALGHGRWQLLLRRPRRIRPGRYTLTLRSRGGKHRVVCRTQITLR